MLVGVTNTYRLVSDQWTNVACFIRANQFLSKLHIQILTMRSNGKCKFTTDYKPSCVVKCSP